ncbi:MAG TPA: O-antigen ligase family protein [Verrucomicrobiae bacterium]|nr:O-antigen ligase family protein [Verrucomicrobiae bacterium]
MKRAQPQTPEHKQPDRSLQTIFAAVFGGLLGLSLLKFGNPILMEKLVDRPTNSWEWLLNPWPVIIGYWLLAGVTVMGLVIARWKTRAPKILVAMPLVWLAWEIIAAMHSESPKLSWPVVGHFLTCVVCFYLGLFSLSRVERMWPFWMGLIAGFFIVFAFGFEQHFGGLEESRKYWLLYVYPTLKEIQPALYKKMTTNRIFSTLFYPNTLAGVILLLLPMTVAVFWSCRQRFTIGARWLLMGLAAIPAFACLYWSGSKGGWLLMLVIGLLAAMYLPIQRRIKTVLIVAVLVLGLAGFFAKYAGFFKKGATSVVARFDYWEAALKTTASKPVFGNGPGTFGEAYKRIKRPESEMSLLTHNDYLEQACDSGVLGFVTFTGFIAGSLVYVWRRGGLQNDWIKLAVWLGVLGWALQSFVEFGLYIPALSWPAFGFLGWLLGRGGNQFDRQPTAS